MAKFVLTDVAVSIAGTDFSDHIASVAIDVSSDEVETTSFGNPAGFRTRVGGLKDASITLSFHNDFATTGSGAIDQTIWSLFNTAATVIVRPTSSAVSASNPSYTGVFLVSQVNPISGSVGDLATRDLTWPLAGTAGLTRATA